MRIMMKIGDCVVEFDDNSAKEPLSPKWSDQLDRLSRIITEVEKSCIALYDRQTKGMDNV